MNFKKLLTSPPPTTAWSLDGTVAAALRRDNKGSLYSAAAAMPADAVEVGPVGLQSVDRERLQPVVSSLQAAVEGARRAAVIIPTGWVRCHLLELEQVPRRHAEVNEILRWRFKRLLPVPPSELRLSWVPAGSRNGKRLLLVMTGIERAFAALEQSFQAVGVEPGLVTPRLFALAQSFAGADGAAPRLLIQQESGFLSLVVMVGASVPMLRTKPVPADSAAWESVRSELHLTRSYLRESLALQAELRVSVIAESAEAEELLRDWWEEQDGVSVAPRPQLPVIAQPGLAERLGRGRTAPMLTVVQGDMA